MSNGGSRANRCKSCCVVRIMEQHSREVSEMDDLLQEELQLAKATQQQNVKS